MHFTLTAHSTFPGLSSTGRAGGTGDGLGLTRSRRQTGSWAGLGGQGLAGE